MLNGGCDALFGSKQLQAPAVQDAAVHYNESRTTNAMLSVDTDTQEVSE